MIITIDGPAGAGKSTAARGLASRLGFEFLDTGAMYRAVAWACLNRGVSLDNHPAVAAVAQRLSLAVSEQAILCDGRDVTAEIRTPDVSAAASVVAAVPEVRREMVRLQRAVADGRKIVCEGRDQGSVVFPDAQCKFFLVADVRKRAERRRQELQERGQVASLERVESEILDRDERDKSRAVAPLIKPADAIEVDTSDKSANDVIDLMESLARKHLGLARSADYRPN